MLGALCDRRWSEPIATGSLGVPSYAGARRKWGGRNVAIVKRPWICTSDIWDCFETRGLLYLNTPKKIQFTNYLNSLSLQFNYRCKNEMGLRKCRNQMALPIVVDTLVVEIVISLRTVIAQGLAEPATLLLSSSWTLIGGLEMTMDFDLFSRLSPWSTAIWPSSSFVEALLVRCKIRVVDELDGGLKEPLSGLCVADRSDEALGRGKKEVRFRASRFVSQNPYRTMMRTSAPKPAI